MKPEKRDGKRISPCSQSTWIQPALKLSFLTFKAIKFPLASAKLNLNYILCNQDAWLI